MSAPTKPAMLPMPMPMLDVEALVQVTPTPPQSGIVHSPCLEPPRMQKVPRVSPRMRYSAAEMQVHCSLVPPWGAWANGDRQCTKAGVECMFYDHGRNQLLPRRYVICRPALFCGLQTQLYQRAGGSCAALVRRAVAAQFGKRKPRGERLLRPCQERVSRV